MRTTITTALAVILILAQSKTLSGEENGNISDKARLQQALFAEEAERDLAKAARGYELLVEKYTAARQIGVSALYRLAEVRRKQNSNDEAAKLYLRIASEFPETPEARLSRENLSALGVGLPASPKRIPDDPDETKELRRLMMLARNSPERIWEEVPLALNDKGNQTTSPLSKAGRRGWLRVVAFLAEHHKKTGRKQRELDLALYSAARAGQVESCRLLKKNGATLEIAKHALVEAIENNHQAVGDWLLAQGVDINTPGQGRVKNLEHRKITLFDPYSGEERAENEYVWCLLTPLGAAIAADDPEWIDRLLKLEADVNHQGTKDRSVDISPLSLACWKGHAPLVKRLLDLGADPNCPDRDLGLAGRVRRPASPADGWLPLHYAADKPEIVALLMAAGADARSADAEGFTPLHAAAYLNSANSCELLLKAGAVIDPAARLSWLGDKSWTPAMLASAHANQEDGGAAAKEVIQMLIKHGADTVPDDFAPRDLVDLCPVIKLRVWLAEMIRYPEIARAKGISVVLPAGLSKHLLVAHPADGSAPPTLAEVLLGWFEAMAIEGTQNYQIEIGAIRRATESGQFQRIPFKVTDLASHPKLQWGDIIEFLPVDMEAAAYVRPWTSKKGPTHVRSTLVGLDPEIYLKLFTQMEVNVTIAWPDRPRQVLSLRGGLWIYDPGSAEAPLVSPRALHKLLGGLPAQSLRLTRSEKHGGGVVDIPKDQYLPSGIRFLDGDVLTVGAIDPAKARKFREENIQLIEPKSGFRWAQGAPVNAGPEVTEGGFVKPAVYPTLFQFLTEFYLPLETFELESMSEILSKENDFKKWSAEEIAHAVRLSGVAPWVTIRHPDLREIWIDRLSGERIRFPLAELMAQINADTPDDFFRKSDIELQAGDLVEIRLLPDSGKDAWKGFDLKTTRFIQKALTYDFRRGETFDDGFSHRVQWTAPHWFETSAGPVAVGQTDDKPFIMEVNEFGRKRVKEKFKWGLEERWLRQGVLVQEKQGRHILTPKCRMAGSGDHFYGSLHSGFDDRGLLKSLRPQLNPSRGRTAPSHRPRYVPRPR